MNRATAVIGLEIHVQLKTATKLFCGDRVEFAAEPNTHVCPVCLGLPGALPVPNQRAIELGVRAAAALRCTVHQTSRFVRKHYFYPDLPKGYQITQHAEPLASHGELRTFGTRVRIRRMHLEEDAGKLLHDRIADRTAIDFNRAGAPLLEIVTEPDITSPAEARAFLVQLKRTLQYIDVSDCEMEKGTLRVDANVSLAGDPAARTELKNLNSFAAIERALHAELRRQRTALEAGAAVGGVTLSWNDVIGELRVLRPKEQTSDYRYINEPDLPPLVLDDVFVATNAQIPELPQARADRMIAQYGIKPADVQVLTASRPLADYFEELVALTGDARAASAWTRGEVLSTANALQTEFAVSAREVAELIGFTRAGALTTNAARTAFRRMAETGRSARAVIEEAGLAATASSDLAEEWAREIARDHPREVERLRQGEKKIMEFLIGQLMRRAEGRLDHHTARVAIGRAIQSG